ncbi:hypothetical protein LSUE1_G009517, partial [Lachnellula suecica]
MPLPDDNLYSAEDSDAESFSEELSPSDGYFNRDDRPPEVMIPDPSMDDKKVEDKTLIPTPNPQASTGGTSRSSFHPMLSQSSSSRPCAPPPSSENSSSLPSRYTPIPRMSSRRPASFSENTPLINVPPPAYSESPIPSASNPSQGQGPSQIPSQDQAPSSPHLSRNESTYRTFADHNLERGFLPVHAPESMGGPIDVDERTPLSGDKPGPSRRRFILKKLLFIAVVFAAITAMVTTMLYRHTKASSSYLFLILPFSLLFQSLSGINRHTLHYVIIASSNTNIIKDPKPGKDAPPYKDGTPEAKSYCLAASIRRDPVVYEFPIGTDLHVLQTIHNGDGGWSSSSVKTAGEIHLRRAPKNGEHGNQAYFTVEVHVSDPDLNVLRTWDEDSRSLRISTPTSAKLSSRGPHCVSVEITAWFPEDAEFTDLQIEAISLTFRVFDDIKINVSRRSKLTTLNGNIYFPTISGNNATNKKDSDAPEVVDRANLHSQGVLSNEQWFKAGPSHPFSSRRIIVETVSGSINGAYPLLDFLGLSTESGSISAGVLPQEAAKDAPKPADLEVQTSSGSIRVDFPTQDTELLKVTPPARNYIANVHSSSGSIDGTFYLGSLASFKSTSGSIRINALPIVQASTSETADDSPVSRFITDTVSGNHDIKVLDPIFISRLSSAHSNQANRRPRPDPYNPMREDQPHITLPANIVEVEDRSLTSLDSSETSKQKLRNLQSKHTSSSASVEVSYPSVWEGTVSAKTVSGDIEVKGKGLRTVRERKGWAYKEVLARKGVDGEGEGSFVEMSDVAGEL